MEQVLSLIKLHKNEKQYTSLVSLDFREAFDNLPWDLAIQALKRLKISEQLLNLLISFLYGRRALVDWMAPEILFYFCKGCPQGSCLGPFLWMVLLETLLALFDVRDCELVAYADDVLLIIWAKSRAQLEFKGKQALAVIEDWAVLNGIQISQPKSRVITFGKPTHLDPERGPIYKIQDKTIKAENTLTYLGVVIDIHLSFLPHIVQKRNEINIITQNLYKFS